MAEVQKADEFADVSELDTVAQEIKQQESAESETKSVIEDIIPDEFKGKSVAEIAAIALHARREMGRQGNELGEVRKLADELIKSTLHKPKEQQEISNEVDIFTDPQEAMRRAIESNPVVRHAATYAEEAKRALAVQQLANRHPDFMQVANDPKMLEWKAQNPILGKAFDNANANYDAATAIELLNVFKATQVAHQTQVSDAEKTARTKTMNAASVDTGGSGEKSKKIFRRADIMKLMVRDRKKYDSMQGEIMQAYSEGRVR